MPRSEDLENAQTVRYEIYGHDYSVRTNIFDDKLSLLIGAATFLAPAPLAESQADRFRYRVEFPDLPPGSVWTGLPSTALSGVTSFSAQDYDQLIDSPFVWGPRTEVLSFVVNGLEHTLVQGGDSRFWNTKTLKPDLTTLIDHQHKFWGSIPYQDYTIINLIVDGRGGLEHHNSTILMTTRDAQRQRSTYLSWLSLVSHELFHVWNVKAIGPSELEPFDYENEVYTTSLWIAEGITSYYDDLLVRRSGLSSRNEYLKALSSSLKDVLSTPGRKEIPLTQASFDAWIRLYQPTEDTVNASVNYYSKGAIVAWLLDTEIRRRTKDKLSLDDVMRAALGRFHSIGFEESEFRRLTEEVTGLDLSDFFSESLDSTEELNITPALEYFGLALEDAEEMGGKVHGITSELQDGRWIVKTVAKDSPAWRAGVSPADELIAADGLRLENHSNGLKWLEELPSDHDTFSLTVARRGELRTFVLSSPWLAPPATQIRIARNERLFERRRAEWLGPERRSD